MKLLTLTVPPSFVPVKPGFSANPSRRIRVSPSRLPAIRCHDLPNSLLRGGEGRNLDDAGGRRLGRAAPAGEQVHDQVARHHALVNRVVVGGAGDFAFLDQLERGALTVSAPDLDLVQATGG